MNPLCWNGYRYLIHIVLLFCCMLLPEQSLFALGAEVIVLIN